MSKINIKEIKNKLILQGFTVDKLKKWHVGTSRNCFIVWMNKERFVLKLFDKSKKETTINRMIAAMQTGILKLEEEYDGSKYRTQLVHRDLHFDNVLYDKKTKNYCIIDTSDLENSILSQEIMVMMSYLIRNNNYRNKKMITELMSGYESQIKLTKKEKMAIPLLIIVRKLGECLWLIEQYKKEKLNRKDRNFFLKDSVEQLEIAVKQFDNLKKIFDSV